MDSKTITFNTENYDDLVKEGVSLIDFWAPWCEPCRMQGPIVESIAGKVNGNAKVGKLNVDENPGVAAAFGVSGIPTVILIKDGTEVERFVGVQSEEVLTRKLNEYIENHLVRRVLS